MATLCVRVLETLLSLLAGLEGRHYDTQSLTLCGLHLPTFGLESQTAMSDASFVDWTARYDTNTSCGEAEAGLCSDFIVRLRLIYTVLFLRPDCKEST
jgi:hypothetical protein